MAGEESDADTIEEMHGTPCRPRATFINATPRCHGPVLSPQMPALIRRLPRPPPPRAERHLPCATPATRRRAAFIVDATFRRAFSFFFFSFSSSSFASIHYTARCFSILLAFPARRIHVTPQTRLSSSTDGSDTRAPGGDVDVCARAKRAVRKDAARRSARSAMRAPRRCAPQCVDHSPVILYARLKASVPRCAAPRCYATSVSRFRCRARC